MVRLVINGLIHIHGLPLDLTKRIKAGLSIENPLYKKLVRMKNIRALYNCKEFIPYYEEDKDTGRLSVGRGVQKRLEEFLKNHRIPYQIQDDRVSCEMERKDYLPIKLRDYQLGIPDEIIKHEYGTVHLPTAFGKTIIALEVARQLGLRTLIIVPRIQLANQFRDAIRVWFQDETGELNGDKLDLKDFTVVTWQTLTRHMDSVPDLMEVFGTVFIDECHTAITKQRRRALAKLKPKYLYGLTATPRRTDKQDEAIIFTFGPIICEGSLPQEDPTVEVVKYHKQFAHWEYGEIAKSITEDETRNQLIADLVERESGTGRRVLVLTKRIKHYERIEKTISPNGADGIYALSSKQSAKRRKELFGQLATGQMDFKVLLGTFSLLAVGVDLPSLDTLIIAGDLRSDVLTEQSVGRIKRLFAGKQTPKIIDIVDSGNPLLYNQAKARKKFYEKMGWNIK